MSIVYSRKSTVDKGDVLMYNDKSDVAWHGRVPGKVFYEFIRGKPV